MIVFEILGFLLGAWILLELLGYGFDWIEANWRELLGIGGVVAIIAGIVTAWHCLV